MKYTSVLESNAIETRMTMACSHCGQSLDGGENYCPKCGEALIKLPKEITNDRLAEILTEHILAPNPDAAGIADATKDCEIFVGDINPGSDSVSTFTAPCDRRATMKAEDKLTQLRNCDRFNTGDAKADYDEALKQFGKATGKSVYNATPSFNAVGDFIIWLLSKETTGSVVGRSKDEEDPGPHCRYGDYKPETCGHCTAKGACDMCELATMPPKYDMCPFRGSGFIFCRDAE